MAQALPHAIMYSAGQHMHYDMSQYYTPAYGNAHFASLHSHSPYPERTMKLDRRRPKYTRSKTGCLTCRKKKVKCDEQKPKCTRCANSTLECCWPDPPPPKKKSAFRGKRASTADDVTSASDAGTSSLSPSASGEIEGTPQLAYVSAPVSPTLGHHVHAPQLRYNDGNVNGHEGGNVNLVQVPAGGMAVNDRRHSNPDVQEQLSAISTMQSRRHSTQLTDHQRFGQLMGNGGALGLSLNQQQHQTNQAQASRPSTPSDFLYPHAHAHAPAHTTQGQTHGAAGYTGYSPSGSLSILPNLSGASGSASSRPSTAASSLSLAHSLSRRTSAGTSASRPSTAGSLAMSTSSASAGVRQYAQQQHQPYRPGSACSATNGVAGPGAYAHAHSPFSFNYSGSAGVMPASAAYESNTAVSVMAHLGGYSQPASRPGTAGSGLQSSPYMRQHAANSNASTVNANKEQWQPSPMLGQSPLIAPHAQLPVAESYFQQLIQTPPMGAVPSPAHLPMTLSRTHSPAGAWN